MGDFGTALVFFVTYLVIAFMRSGDFATVFLSVAGAALAGFLALTVKPYIKARFAVWGHVWEDTANRGYQQTRTMAAAASGGLFGSGAGKGWLKRIFAADTDLVFGMVAEELGLVVALSCVLALVALVVYAWSNGKRARSSFYVIAACAAGTLMTLQAALNVLGSVDILPLTGVTFPFVSKGGTSLVTSFGLLAFIKEAQREKD
ncbi:MAG: FtsW/RodA/SpoVE family cell cycle protein, partial [Oscillospiraceae bacterium]|jgi:cell division protein FtsW (lipid II flippase)|nr:FtsW/RodA/SpoVE family cell cycle protein [Oscillospiraceae bacterium]